MMIDLFPDYDSRGGARSKWGIVADALTVMALAVVLLLVSAIIGAGLMLGGLMVYEGIDVVGWIYGGVE